MRRILNLDQPGIVFAKIIGLFVAVIPAVLYGILLLFHGAEIVGTILGAIRISFAIGAVVFVILLALIIVEQIQDHYIDIAYQKNRARRLPLGNGRYECQYCGNRKVTKNEKTCWVCRKELK
jgi:hypothetical protein